MISCRGGYIFRVQLLKKYKVEDLIKVGITKKYEGKYIDVFSDRIMIPILDQYGKAIGFGGRIIDNSSKAKYINTMNTELFNKSNLLFNYHKAKSFARDYEIIVVEGYMDAISLYQRGIDNVVASLGTALTQNQGRLLRKYASQIIIGYDADGAGQTATIRGMEILQNMGCDIRILQLDGDAKDPDEYILKYGSGRLQKRIEEAISLVEFKVKLLKNSIKIETASDKIKFLNEIIKNYQHI